MTSADSVTPGALRRRATAKCFSCSSSRVAACARVSGRHVQQARWVCASAHQRPPQIPHLRDGGREARRARVRGQGARSHVQHGRQLVPQIGRQLLRSRRVGRHLRGREGQPVAQLARPTHGRLHVCCTGEAGARQEGAHSGQVLEALPVAAHGGLEGGAFWGGESRAARVAEERRAPEGVKGWGGRSGGEQGRAQWAEHSCGQTPLPNSQPPQPSPQRPNPFPTCRARRARAE